MAARSAKERTTPAGVATMARPNAVPVVTLAADRPLDTEIMVAKLIRAVHSERQLQEVLVDFWMNHFNVNLLQTEQTASHFEEQAIRRHMLGRFEDLLDAVAHHPRMLFYLDNWRSSAPTEVINERIAGIKKTADVEGQVALLERTPFLKDSKGLNENFGRELLELHTMGVDGGYTQQDVVAVAKILSGWTISTRGLVNGREDDGVFAFDPLMHVDGDKVVLGQTIKSGGVDEGEALLKILARHPSTARFISTKLARRFIADDPPRAVIDQASRTFLKTGGDLREVVRTILTSSEFRSSETLRAKIKKPFELVASALRAVDAKFKDLDVYGFVRRRERQRRVAHGREALQPRGARRQPRRRRGLDEFERLDDSLGLREQTRDRQARRRLEQPDVRRAPAGRAWRAQANAAADSSRRARCCNRPAHRRHRPWAGTR